MHELEADARELKTDKWRTCEPLAETMMSAEQLRRELDRALEVGRELESLLQELRRQLQGDEKTKHH